ncbi:phage protein, HK97 gp10 family [Devosia enhydra]|uniref:Phage protein, HK97 gp10 family n=1 Tax=Devosia enhydra TaxID=665118 RepID=A0A1K2HWI9_9HYPH|nr:HK97-gp10 family putative phage morphogenesis protein [Devosia enhydra]SFZ82422.1 phage protein, HK97 gp10 family [Devosia enhydra]
MADDGGLARLNRRMAAIPKAVRDALQPALDKGADEMVRKMKSMAPKEDGDLVGSIRKEPGRHELGRRIVAGGAATTKPVAEGHSAKYDYAVGQEFGTAEMEAQPFFHPAKREVAPRARNRLKREARKAIRSIWGKP